MTTWHSGVVAMMMVVAMTTPVNGDVKDGKWVRGPQWTYQLSLGDDVEIQCNGSSPVVLGGDTLEWRDPFNKVIQPSGDKYELTNRNGVEKYSLVIKKIDMGDSGVYRCRIFRGGAYKGQIVRGLNLYRPLMSTIEAYKINIIVAFVSALISLAIFMGICGIIHYKYEPDSEVLVKASGTTQETAVSQEDATEVSQATQETQETVEGTAEDKNESAKAMGDGIENPAFRYDKRVEATAVEIDTRL